MAFARDSSHVCVPPRRPSVEVHADGSTAESHEPEGTVLIEGTRGTGKRSLARAIHGSSTRRRKMFRVFNCRSCSSLEMRRLFLGELHGDRRGGGRYIRYLGLFEEVAEGTLYLEEIEQLPLDMQRILGEVIREHEFRPIGSDRALPFRGRVILSMCPSSDGGAVTTDLCSELAELVVTETFQTDGPTGS